MSQLYKEVVLKLILYKAGLAQDVSNLKKLLLEEAITVVITVVMCPWAELILEEAITVVITLVMSLGRDSISRSN